MIRRETTPTPHYDDSLGAAPDRLVRYTSLCVLKWPERIGRDRAERLHFRLSRHVAESIHLSNSSRFRFLWQYVGIGRWQQPTIGIQASVQHRYERLCGHRPAELHDASSSHHADYR